MVISEHLQAYLSSLTHVHDCQSLRTLWIVIRNRLRDLSMLTDRFGQTTWIGKCC